MAHEGHDHLPAHGDSHAHTHSDSAQPLNLTRPDLPAGAGSGKLLFLDAPSGLAGDMTIAALVDLGVPTRAVEMAVFALPLRGFHLHFSSRIKSGVVATHFDVHVSEPQPERTYASIRDMLAAANLDPAIRERAQRIFRRLAESECKVHRMAIDDVHFHEVGAVDAIVDVVGAAAALEYLGARVVVSPLPMGRGFVKARHGVLPLPPPAVVECLRGFETYDAGIEFELVTPTGAAIVAGSAESSQRWPTMTPIAVGWGAGTANLADRPNLLRAVLGDPSPQAERSHVVLEANLDDATGELVAVALESLFAAGALDAWATPITMKKGRPAFTLSAIAPQSAADGVASAMLRDTTSLGVRRYEVARVERPRRMVDVSTKYGIIAVKVAEGPFGPAQVKPEFDDCVRAAAAHGVPVREVVRAALVAYG
jgi:hypothetical protein